MYFNATFLYFCFMRGRKPKEHNSEYLQVQIGQRIKEMRKAKGYNPTSFAQLLGVDVSSVHRFESGKFNLSVNTLSRIASALNCWVSVILEPKGSE